LRAVPWSRDEEKTGQQIADEFEKLARVLRNWATATSASSRGMEPSKTILQSLQKINAAFAEGLKKGAVDGGLFSTIGREFSKIGETISRLGGGSKQP
jgi:hypothetical protein